MSPVQKYKIFVQARTDLTAEEIERYEASRGNGVSPKSWPWRDTGEIIHARRRNNAKAFYRALKQVPTLIKLRADRIDEDVPPCRGDDISMRAWRGFPCICGSIEGVEDEVKHFEWSNGRTACGLEFSSHWKVNGKPECDKCLAAAMEKHPEMKQYL